MLNYEKSFTCKYLSSKWTSACIREKLGISSSIRDRRKEVRKQGRLPPTPADILVNI